MTSLPTPSSNPGRRTLFVIGDSISIQYGPHLEAALPEEVDYFRKEGVAEAFVNLDIPRGANGGDSGRVRAYLEQLSACEDFTCDLMLINCGLHDIKGDPKTGARQVESSDYRKNLEAIVRLSERMTDQLVWVRTTPVDDVMHAARGAGFSRVQADVERYNAIASEVMAASGVQELPLDAFTRDLASEGELFRDGVHFTPAVQKQQGEYIARFCMEVLGS